MIALRTSRTFDIFFLLSVTLLLLWASANRIAIGDRIFFLGHQPSNDAIQVASAAGLSATGTRLFYRTDPQFSDKATIESECDIERLGCLSSKGQIFILDDPTKPNQTIVTAAHEMLHLAYRRMSQGAKDELAPLLDEAISLNSRSIVPQLRSLTTPEDRRDEAHSLLGTEYQNLPDRLELYYTAYFTDRMTVITAASSNN